MGCSLALLAESSGAHVDLVGDGSVVVHSAFDDSRKIEPGSLFVVRPSTRTDAASFISDAKSHGAIAVAVPQSSRVAREECIRLGLPYLALPDGGQSFNFATGRILKCLYPEVAKLKVIGVTGTNGKTSTAWFVSQLLRALGEPCVYLGTLGYSDGEIMEEASNTTPFPCDLWWMLRRAVNNGARYVVLEASSHALFQRRLSGVPFIAGVFTNLTQDHLDFHGTMQAYAESKKLLFTEHAAASVHGLVGIFNAGDATTDTWRPDLACPILRYGKGGDFEIAYDEVGLDRLRGKLPDGRNFSAPIGGAFGAENLTASLATVSSVFGGTLPAEVVGAVGGLKPVPGRFQPIPNDKGVAVIVDYAHTPDAIVKLLTSARDLAPRRIITVFGCGGDRDKTKRPLMASAASELSDLTVVTSDNPRTENPDSIIADVLEGIIEGAEVISEPDRPKAIHLAISWAMPGDLVVIAGKGHENYQIIGHEKHPMDDAELAAAALEARR
ncbi:MAG: UDP-N-acetylmuramoyl-L-alanyl-D-glutamate--2,6-diaminopimelate ligase [Armatimonadetes bacterium]|nr:UDP-N-acetylmuramoyl-L-alanyl-D-glutamate--2,6-diaminopimelate ligase [Armatimonadota bacterium]